MAMPMDPQALGFSFVYPVELTYNPYAVQRLDQWAAQRGVTQSFPLTTLKDAVIGIDASYYLDLRVNGSPKDEPLKHAIGGVPFCLKGQITDDIECLQDAGVKVIFVFNGLDHANKPKPEFLSQDSMRAAEAAWQKHRNGDMEAINLEFSKAKYPIEYLYRWLQGFLVKKGIEYLVAPYSAVAQLSYMVKLSEQYIDCIFGSTDYFLFNVDKVITNVQMAREVKDAHFTWISKSICEERLKVTPDALRDAQLLLGTSFSPIFPPLERSMHTPKGVSIQDAVSLLNGQGRNVLQLCNSYRDGSNANYAESYKKAFMSIRHHVAMETNGAIGPLNFEQAPGDVHEYIGRNLPHELFFYLSRGIIGPELPNWVAQDRIELYIPPGVMNTKEYQDLVYEQLNPIRAMALKIITENMNNYYRFRNVEMFGLDGEPRRSLDILLRDVVSVKDKVSSWKVKTDIMGGRDFTMLACLQSLKDSDFRQKTLNTGKPAHAYPALRTANEVVANTFFRFLHARQYINDKHELTNWGQILETVLTKLGSISRAEDTAVLAVELLRLGLLNGNKVGGDDDPSKDTDPRASASINLVSKIACLTRFSHKELGYHGPLDQQLMSFGWAVSALRVTLRVLMEAILVSMFLAGEAERERSDWTDISTR